MKKIALLVVAFVCASSSAFAAVVSWGGGWAGSNPDLKVTGTAYLVQATASTPVDIADIATTLKNSGIQTDVEGFLSLTPDGIALVDSNTIGSNLEAPVQSATSPDNYFVVVITTDGHFMISEYKSGTTLDMGGGRLQYDVIFTAGGPNAVEWVYDTLGGGEEPVDPGVPEPTALALLALGVAGVALRRRVA